MEKLLDSSVWITKTPTKPPAFTKGTPRNERYGSSPASGMYLNLGCENAFATITGRKVSATNPTKPSVVFSLTLPMDSFRSPTVAPKTNSVPELSRK